MDQLRTHPIIVSNNLNNRARIISFVNERGYRSVYGHYLSYRNFDRDIPRLLSFLDGIQNENEFQEWAANVEVGEQTQRPHQQRELRHNIAQEIEDLAYSIQTKEFFNKDIETYTKKIDDGFERLSLYVQDDKLQNPEWLDLEYHHHHHVSY